MANPLDDDQPVYVISVASELSGLHPQTLRQYERLGLVSPDRSGGRNRRYSMADIMRLREVQQLASEGLNLAGIQRVLALEAENQHLRARLAQYEREKTSTALVVWRPRPRR
ncbi:MAG: MerR family transcriptional regulator [Candidatus Nanopelagicales bacterium]